MILSALEVVEYVHRPLVKMVMTDLTSCLFEDSQ